MGVWLLSGIGGGRASGVPGWHSRTERARAGKLGRRNAMDRIQKVVPSERWSRQGSSGVLRRQVMSLLWSHLPCAITDGTCRWEIGWPVGRRST